tara:strand:- start:588 stop:896 length:309 start_codon:yes stop_codon:yes gene_type:complete
MNQAQFLVGQEVRFRRVSKKYARKGGVIKSIVDCYNLNKELCRYPNQLTTVKKYSDGNVVCKGYIIGTFQPEGYRQVDVTMTEGMLVESTKKNIINSYITYA